MNKQNKAARTRMKNATKAEWERITDAANLNETEKALLWEHLVKCSSLRELALTNYTNEHSISKTLAGAYRKIAKLEG